MQRLVALKIEHRDLDDVIQRLSCQTRDAISCN